METNKEFSGKKLKNANDVVKIMDALLPKDIDHEECWAIFLRRDNAVLSLRQITIGNLFSVIFDPRRIAKYAILADAAGVIVCHNHPSGNETPSKADIQHTEKLRNALQLFEIELVDHVILGDESFYSFADEKSTKRPK